MITHRFVAKELGSTNNYYPILKTAGRGDEDFTDMVMVPLELHIPLNQVGDEGIDPLEKRIVQAVERMVKELNSKGGK